MKYGYFDNDKREYIIDKVEVPTSWTNYLGVEERKILDFLKGMKMYHVLPIQWE